MKTRCSASNNLKPPFKYGCYQVLQMLVILASLPINNVSTTGNFTKQCSKTLNSEVVWNITYPREMIYHSNIVMQTKDYFASDVSWVNLTNCVQSSRFIRCEIDDKKRRYMYHLRLVRFTNFTNYDILVPKGSGHYQNGFQCYHDHGAQNLTATLSAMQSVHVSWCFYPWDVPILESVTLTVKAFTKGDDVYHSYKLVGEYPVPLNAQTELHQSKVVHGLTSCTKYLIEVFMEFGYKLHRKKSMVMTTKCDISESNTSGSITKAELVAVVMGPLLLISVSVMAVWFVYKWRTKEKREQLATDDVIDVRHLEMMPGDGYFNPI